MFNDITLLSNLSRWIQIVAIVLVFLGGSLQLAKFFLDQHISNIKDKLEYKKDVEYKAKIATLDNSSEFYQLSVALSSDSRSALDRVMVIANDPSDSRQQMAYNLLADFPKEAEHMNLLVYPIDWKKAGLDPSKISLDDFRKSYSSTIPIYQTTIMEAAWRSMQIPKRDRILFLLDIINSTSSIRCLRSACLLLNEEAKIDKNFLAWQLYGTWWSVNNNKY